MIAIYVSMIIDYHMPVCSFYFLTNQLSSVQNPSIIPLYWLVYGDSPFLDYDNPQYIKGSMIPELIINQQGF